MAMFALATESTDLVQRQQFPSLVVVFFSVHK